MTSLSENTVVTTSGGLVEVARVSRTSNYSIDSTSVSTAANIFATNATFVGDGSDYEIEFYAPEVYTALNAGAYVYVYLTDGGSTSLGAFGAVAYGDGTRAGYGQMYGKYILSTTAGTVYSLNARGTYSVATGTMLGGNGQASGRMPIYMTVRKVVQASQFIVPLASAPLVTSLPSAPIDGQEIRYVADATNGIVWNFRYDGLGTYPWKFIGGPNLFNINENTANSNGVAGSWADVASASITIPLAGDYLVFWTGHAGIAANEQAHVGVYANGTDSTDAQSGFIYGQANIDAEIARTRKITVTTAASVMKTRCKMTTAVARTFRGQSIVATPIQVKAG